MTIVHFGFWQCGKCTTVITSSSPEWAGKGILNPARSLQIVSLALAGRTFRHSRNEGCALCTLPMWEVYNCHHFQLPRMGRQDGIEYTPLASKCCSLWSGARITAFLRWQLYTLDAGNVESVQVSSLSAPQNGPAEMYWTRPVRFRILLSLERSAHLAIPVMTIIHFTLAKWKVHNTHYFQLHRMGWQQGIESTQFASECRSLLTGAHISAFPMTSVHCQSTLATWKVYNCHHFRLPRMGRQEGIESTQFASNVALALGRASRRPHDDSCTLWTLAIWKVPNCHYSQLLRVGRQEGIESNPVRFKMLLSL